jgi:hypothetical protein
MARSLEELKQRYRELNSALARATNESDANALRRERDQTQEEIRRHPDAKPSDMSRPLDDVDLARTARCTYCRTAVSMSARTLGQHRATGGVCSGSGRRVASFDQYGQAIFEAQTFASQCVDKNGQPLTHGDRVRDPATGDTNGKIYKISADNEWVQVDWGGVITNDESRSLVKMQMFAGNAMLFDDWMLYVKRELAKAGYTPANASYTELVKLYNQGLSPLDASDKIRGV